ncbi:BCCT family transporter, partial [Klebsiella pneumoniae]|uniref:BCCT family transporter n=1 Tax=Klebsiella pneumoniae TaxID=573 RepID=UPI003968AEC8
IGFPQRAGEWLLAAQTWASQTVGWYYLLAMALYLIFVVVTALSGYGKVKLGADHVVQDVASLSSAASQVP